MDFNSKLIVLEGCDGAGKTTMLENLKKAIKAHDKKIKTMTLSLPSTRAFGYSKIRSILRGEFTYPTDLVQSLFLMNMIDTNTRFINPFFEENPKNAICIVDRSIISTILYNALSRGSIYRAIQFFMNEHSQEVNKNHTLFDFDIINKEYGQLTHMVDHVFFIEPPRDVVVERAKERRGEENNDSVSSVQRTYMAYHDFYEFLTGKMFKNIVDFIECPDNTLVPKRVPENKFIRLNDWNRAISDEKNHAIHMDTILTVLGIK